VILVPNGIDMAIYENMNKRSNGPCIVQIANMRPQKGYSHIADIGVHLNRFLKEFKWLCVGSLVDATYFSQVKHRLSERNLQDHVTFLGSRSDVHLLLACATVGVLTSDDEGMPLALLEYMAAGLPVVVTDVGECRRVVESAGCGFVISCGKHAEFAEAITWLCQNPEQAAIMGQRGRKAVREHYSVEKIFSKVQDFYCGILGITQR
jgi:glycosyltransferase involved in cell wall biosynthesis